MASQIASAMTGIGKTIGTGIMGLGNYTAQAASRANGVSFASQAAQGAFNQASANIANSLGTDRLAEQYAFNAAGANNANAFSEYMWDKSAAFNREMLERQMEFNAEQAKINREWQEQMRATAYQTAVKDMETAGLNPILAVTGGGIQTGAGSGGAASASLPQMSGAQGAMASGGLLNGIAASEGNFQGQMEYMGGMLGLISAVFNGFSSAFKGMGSLGDLGAELGKSLGKVLEDGPTKTADKWVPPLYDLFENEHKTITGNGYIGGYYGAVRNRKND